MCPLLGKLPIVYDNHPVHLSHGCHAVGDDDPRGRRKTFLQRFFDLGLQVWVDPARCLIEDEIPRLIRDDAADGDQLLFTLYKSGKGL